MAWTNLMKSDASYLSRPHSNILGQCQKPAWLSAVHKLPKYNRFMTISKRLDSSGNVYHGFIH
jgi:hypothetical protein